MRVRFPSPALLSQLKRSLANLVKYDINQLTAVQDVLAQEASHGRH